MRKLLQISPTRRFYYVLAGCIALFGFSFTFNGLFEFARICLASALVMTLADSMLMLTKELRIQTSRSGPGLLSLGASNTMYIRLKNLSGILLFAEVIDELPAQIQNRNFKMFARLDAGIKTNLVYQIRPLTRGLYSFGCIHVFLRSGLGLVRRHFRFESPMAIPVYPSITEMKKFELSTFSDNMLERGIRKIRRIGHSYDFEKIKDYETGDEYKSINWRATGRKGKLMVNQYENEKSQQVYCVIDISRSMQLPFDGLSLLDYAVNASLAVSNIIIRKQDKAGLITVSSEKVQILQADRSRTQLKRILEGLYNIHEQTLESNLELLYSSIRSMISRRSLFFLYTNFESIYALERALPILRKMNTLHLLVVVFFENSGVGELSQKEGRDLEGIYVQTIAQKFVTTKLQILHLLKKHGIQAIYTRPAELTMNTVNKYLEMKSRGMI